ncbi:hypothetical protein BDR03DRAFT_949106 [Suillus americanus]|nr:hypothetical protein BDR03DRAFT_949106 [Suillus americanus]
MTGRRRRSHKVRTFMFRVWQSILSRSSALIQLEACEVVVAVIPESSVCLVYLSALSRCFLANFLLLQGFLTMTHRFLRTHDQMLETAGEWTV